MSIKMIIYSNTDYLDILRIQTEHVSKYENTVLFINKNELDISDILAQYSSVIYYDNSKPYASRLLECVNQLDSEYFLLTHDIDILLSLDEIKISNLKNMMSRLEIDRIDLKYTKDVISDTYICIDGDLDVTEIITALPACNTFLVKQNNVTQYIYNVNPSIWKKSTLVEILTNFKYKGYRDIEYIDVQKFCSKFNVYKIHSNLHTKCGYFECVELYKFLHITHSGRLMTLNYNNTTEYGQSYEDVSSEFRAIVDKHNLKESPRWNQ